MSSTWSSQPSQAAAQAAAVILAGPQERVLAWVAGIQADARFRVLSYAHSLPDLQSKLAANPELLLLDASIFPGPEALIDILTRFQKAAFVLAPFPLKPEEETAITTIPCVKALFKHEVSLPELAGQMYGTALSLRSLARPELEKSVWEGPGKSGLVPVATRIIAVWNQMGGVGKTTLATNLAYESARRGLPTLLVGLGAPDDLPLIMNLTQSPNITTWRSNPTLEGLRQSIQKKDKLHVIAGFPDLLSGTAMAEAGDGSLNDLVILGATRAGYAVIILDVPASTLAGSAIAAANTLVLVARPSLEGVLRSVEAVHTVVERMSGKHTIPPEGIHVVLNRLGGRLEADEWHRSASASLKRSFPPIVAQIPDDPRVGAAQDNKNMPLLASDTFARALRPLADSLLAVGDRPLETGSFKKTFQLGPVKIKV
jgi:arsenite-transporting ATPase